MKQLVQLFIKCRNLKDVDLRGVTDPQVMVYRKYKLGDESWEKVGQTEMIKETLNPDFVESITMEFFFEKHIYLKFEVIDGD